MQCIHTRASPLSNLLDPYNRWRLYSEYHLLEDDMEADTTVSQAPPPYPSPTLTVFPKSAEPVDAEKCHHSEAEKRSRWNKLLWRISGIVLGVAIGITLIVTLALHFGKRHGSPPPVDKTKITGPVVDTWIGGPVIATNFADPCFVEVDKTYYAFATNRYINPHPQQVNIQLAVSNDFSTWNLTSIDALPDVGPWSTGTYVWAPDVVQLDNGSFVMYYSARHLNATTRHCIGAATSHNVEGPYKPLPKPLACPLSQGGAIDPDGFEDVDGSRYVIYKVDGNSLNTKRNHTLHSTHLMLQEVDPNDGITLVGDPIPLLDRSPEDGPLIEAPSLMRASDISGKNPVYVLFYSSNVFTSPHYDVRYATSSNGIKGPYTKSGRRLLQTGDDAGRLYGPGGLDVGVGGQKVVFHSGYDGGSLVRQMWTGQIAVNGTTIYI